MKNSIRDKETRRGSADRISLIDTELIWESPDPEWQETSMFTDVRNLITRNCLLPELNR